MGHIPDNAEWYIANLVMEITVSGARSNVVHRNLVLISASSPEEAYIKAAENGRSAETEYKNLKDQLVQIRFRGIAQLDVLYEPLADGSELNFEERLAVTEPEIQAMIPPKERLNIFTPPTPGLDKDPDYRSAAVIEMAVAMLDQKPDDREGRQ